MDNAGYSPSADKLIARLFAAQEALNPDADPGDLTINVQDDTPMVTASQGRSDLPDQAYGWPVAGTWIGNTVEGVLLKMVEHYESLAAASNRSYPKDSASA